MHRYTVAVDDKNHDKKVFKNAPLGAEIDIVP